MSLATNVTDLATRVATEFKTLRTLTGVLTDLTTTAKGSLVAAINEVKASSSGAPPASSETVAGVVELATLAEVATGTDTTRAVTVAGVRQERSALKAEILGGAGPTIDTLQEIAALVTAAEESSEIAALTTAVGNRVRFDAAQSLTSPQQSQARQNIDAASATDVGSTTTNFVTVFEAGLV